MTRPIQARIRASALSNNLAVARRAARGSKLFAVIKANAYGHGLLRAARALREADGLAVLELDEAVRLREAGFDRPILLLEGLFEPPELPLIIRHRLAVVLHSAEQLRMLETLPVDRPLDVFLKVNTGMNRLGLAPEAVRPTLERLAVSGKAGQITLMTHFACADDELGIRWQLDRFRAATEGLDLPVSLANSAALLRHPEAAGAWARVGIILYGASPFRDETAAQLGLEPAMTLSSSVIAVHALREGESVGYGAAFRAPGPMRIGIAACGYADGYPRHAGTGTPVLVGGRRTRTLGRVSMDMLCVDLTGLPEAGVGTPVVLWGEGLPVEEVAAAAGTISYELLCALSPRVPVVDVP